jgi:hypothetical protein
VATPYGFVTFSRNGEIYVVGVDGSGGTEADPESSEGHRACRGPGWTEDRFH